jgi:hypothetical protein
VYNFDHENPPISPLTGKPVTTWYKPGQTWGSVFGGLAGAYEVRVSTFYLRKRELTACRNAALSSLLCT